MSWGKWSDIIVRQLVKVFMRRTLQDGSASTCSLNKKDVLVTSNDGCTKNITYHDHIHKILDEEGWPKTSPYLNRNWRPRILLISPFKKFPLFYSIKDFLTLYEHLSRVGIDHTFTCLLQWKGHILPHLYLAYKEVGISHKLTRSFHCSDAQNQSGRPTICKLRETAQLQYFWLQIAKPKLNISIK